MYIAIQSTNAVDFTLYTNKLIIIIIIIIIILVGLHLIN